MSNPTNYPDTVADAVRRAMEAAGVTAHSLSKGAPIPYTTLTRHLACVDPFTLPELARIAAFLDVDVRTLTAPKLAA